MEKLLEVKNLSNSFILDGREIQVLNDVSFSIDVGESLAIVGESGSGKSVTAKSILRLIPSPPGRIHSGEILFQGEDILNMSNKQMRKIRGNRISMIFQEPMTSLNPVFTSGYQIRETLQLHQGLKKKELRDSVIEMLKIVGIQEPELRAKAYPHELSGGMRQRVMIAMALACQPDILIADEPTTALDPTIQAQILDLIKKLQQKTNMAVITITHDLGIVASNCETVIVMYGGTIMEKADVKTLFYKPVHPYTAGLLTAMPMIHKRREYLTTIKGSVPSFADMPKGCPFYPRCHRAIEKCITQRPSLREIEPNHQVRCWIPN